MSLIDEDKVKELKGSIKEITTSGHLDLDKQLLKNIKSICRISDSYVEKAFSLLWKQLHKQHAEIRFATFKVIEELFQRSHKFRELLVKDFQEFLHLTAETDASKPLPKPVNVAKDLRKKALAAVKQWNDKFGGGYRKLALGFQFLKNCKHVDFEDMELQTRAERTRAAEASAKEEARVRQKLENVTVEMDEKRDDILSCLSQFDACMDLLFPLPVDDNPSFSSYPSASKSSADINPKDKAGKGKEESDEEFLSGDSGDEGVEKEEERLKNKNSGGGERTDLTVTSSGDAKASDTVEDPEDTKAESTSATAGDKDDKSSACEKEIDEGSVETNRKVQENDRDAVTSADKNGTSSKPSEGSDVKHKEDVGSEAGCVVDEEMMDDDSAGDSDEEYFRQLAGGQEDDLRSHGMGSHKFSLTLELSSRASVTETDDNEAIVEALDDAYRLITAAHLPTAIRWLEDLGKAGGSAHLVRRAIDLKRSLETSKEKYQKVDFVRRPRNAQRVVVTDDSDDSDDDDLEDVPEKEGFEPFIPLDRRVEYGLEPKKPSAEKQKEKLVKRIREEEADPTSWIATAAKIAKTSDNTITEDNPPASTSADSCSQEKHELLKKAPKVEFGLDLYHWENPDVEAPKLLVDDSKHRFWAAHHGDGEVAIPGGLDAVKRRTMTFEGKFEKVKWACRAPLPNGRLCPRMDRVKCPFHGQIIARDSEGKSENTGEDDNPSPSDSAQGASAEPWRDAELLRDIEAATGKDLGSRTVGQGRGKGKGKRKKTSQLTNLKKVANTPRKRLEKKILDPRVLKRMSQRQSSESYKRTQTKFASSFNYTHSY